MQKPRYWSQACRELAAGDEVMARLIRRHRGSYLRGKSDAFVTLCRAIVGQQISVQAADSIWDKLSARCVPMAPQTLRRKRATTLTACGLSKQKAACVKEVAGFFLRENITPRSRYWQRMEPADAFAALTAIKGVGKWTFEMFAIFYLRSPDVLPLTDLGLIKAIAKQYGYDELPTRDEIEEIARGWQPWRTVATWYLWRSIDPEPVVY